jgi:hypothetical protein
MSFEWHELSGGGTYVDVVADSAWLLGFLLPMAAGAVAALAWTIVAERRIPWFGRHRDPDFGYRQLLVGLTIAGIVVAGIALEVALPILVPDRYLIGPDVTVDVGGAPAYASLRMVGRMIVIVLGVMSVPLTADILERLDPSRPATWIKTPDAAPTSKHAEPAA